jgi:hypothetical protein
MRAAWIDTIVAGRPGRPAFRDGAFDVVTSMDVLVHFPRGEEQRPLMELTACRPGDC